MQIIHLICLLICQLALMAAEEDCSKMWETDFTSPKVSVCTVPTFLKDKAAPTGECNFPFRYGGTDYSHCIVGIPDIPDYPACKTSTGAWQRCIVPTDTVVFGVTTRKGGSFRTNGASVKGGTMLWITGTRFAESAFSTSPSTASSNMVILTSEFSSYPCEIHPDATTPTQITCFTPEMKEGTYLVQVIVKDNIIPFYQYKNNRGNAYIKVSDASTPIIESIEPTTGLPGSFIDIRGNFKTHCFLRDSDGCADDAGARITRVYVGGQQCQLIDPKTSELFQDVTRKHMKCRLDKPEIGYFRATMLVTNEYGRSKNGDQMSYVSPDENIYNFQTYAQVDSVSPQVGSTLGGTKVTIIGKYLYTDDNVPAKIEIAGQPCKVVEFNMESFQETKIVCETSPKVSVTNTNYGNRGINLIKDNVATNFNDLATAVPSQSASTDVIDKASLLDNGKTDQTIWMKGFLYPRKNSSYEFSVATNGLAKLFISTDATPSNKASVADSTTTKGIVDLKADTYYYFETIASKSGGGLDISVNGKMLDTKLTDLESGFVKNEYQEIEISSTLVPEAYKIEIDNEDSNSTNATATGTGVVQTVVVRSASSASFSLSLYGVNTVMIDFGAEASIVQNALNDMPMMYPNLATVTDEMDTDGVSKKYTITFSVDLGNVPDISESMGMVNATVTRQSEKSGSGSKSFLMINDQPSALFDVKADSAEVIQKQISQSFGIRCPVSIQINDDKDSFKTFDYEDCSWGENMVNETAFCGKCSNKDHYLFKNLNSTLDYKYLCHAYKVSSAVNYLIIDVVDPLFKTVKPIWYRRVLNADDNWHYDCVDLETVYQSSNPTTSYPSASLKIMNIWTWPRAADLHTDVVSLRKTKPLGLSVDVNMQMLESRRMMPTLQFKHNTFTTTKSNDSVSFEFRPTNCSNNLTPFTLKSNDATISQVSAASPPVTGSFNLAWNGNNLNNIASDISESDLSALFQSIQNFGNVNVKRSKDCSGYKWSVKWLSGGNKPAITIASNSLAGESPSIAAKQVEDGCAMFFPLQSDILRTLHDKPQVTVMINDIPSKCTNCSFEWSDSATPVVNTINADTLTAIVITGTGFHTIPENNLVEIGDVPCNITSASATQLVCAAGQNSIGTYSFKVFVLSKGLAVMNAASTATFSLTAASVSPVSGSTGGGNIINISGTGFGKNTTVSVDGTNCKIVSTTYSLIKCTAPANPTQANKQVDIIVSQASYTSTLSQSYLYDFGLTPVVNSVTPNVLSIAGGEIVTAIGSNLPVFTSGVTFGTNEVAILSSNSTHLVVRSPSLQPGIYDFNLLIENLGMAKVSDKIEYRLFITSFSPKIGSLRGGSFVKVNGGGFSTECKENQVSFGTQKCEVQNCTADWIHCKTSSAYIVHQVDNQGSDPFHGKGYAWSVPYLKISIGDSVKWSWKSPTGISTVSYRVLQVDNALSFVTNGFDSGDATAKGSFEHQFNEVGVYHYWSGYVENSKQIIFRGIVEVTASLDKELELNLKVKGKEAQKCHFPFVYNNVEYTACTGVDSAFDWCSPSADYDGQKLRCDINTTSTDSCAGSDLTATSCGVSAPTSAYKMLFTNCAGTFPTVKTVSVRNATFDDAITITGTGFSNNACENQVLIGDHICVPDSSSTTQLVCHIGLNSGLYANYDYQVEVLIKNSGYAIQETNFLVKFLPKVTSFTPRIGSVAGGTKVRIEGDGFLEKATVVIIGQTPYYENAKNVITNSTSIIIETLANKEENNEFKVKVNNIDAICDNCKFNYSESASPLLTSVSPSSINSTTEVQLPGANFGTTASDVTVLIGDINCVIKTVVDNLITCEVDGVRAGNQIVVVHINGVGNARTTEQKSITGVVTVTEMTPVTGSIHGGALVTIKGNGFGPATQISFGDYLCSIEEVTVNNIKCRTTKKSGSSRKKRSDNDLQTIKLTNNGVVFSDASVSYTFAVSATPTVSSVTPDNGEGGSIKITGSGFGIDQANLIVKVGKASCSITSVSNTQIVCTVSAGKAGDQDIIVTRLDQGDSNNNIQYKFSLAISSLSKTEGSIGGGLNLVISGSGFSTDSIVTICDESCKILEASLNKIICQVPAAKNKGSDSSCSVFVTENKMTASSSFNYKLSLTPTLSSSSPARGGTGGGTLITIVGTGFPNDAALVKVTIAGSPCLISSIISTQIMCRTEPYKYSSLIAPITVEIDGSGLALNDGSVIFEYIDLWSSKFTWGGLPPPGEGELAVIGPSQHIYFDAASTPVLKGIIIQGGSLIFDDNQDVALDVEYVIVASGGKFQVGTEDKPFQHKATITMHGSARSVELPIFGAKVLAVRNGTLDLHGKPVGVTWTNLGETATNGSKTIVLKESVLWPLYSQIVIATTGDKMSQGESETRFIVGKSNDNKTLTLDKELDFEHLGVTRTVGSGANAKSFDVRAEVGLLSRNVKFQGHNDNSWNRLKTAEGCDSTFVPSEFATQTCFLGRYGPELGSDEFGGIIFMAGGQNQPKDKETVIGRISNIEAYHVGQAFKLGRYPIHFHMNGDMPSSYVKETAIHQSFNRAINIHASNYLQLTRNVIYNIMGGAYFLEDGIEIGNRFLYNLAVKVKTTSSLLNEDVTPAAFWATNPNNTYMHNAVAGSTHFGWWYRILDHPEGPSFTTDYCPKKIPFGKHFNNSVHSTGRFGMWIFPGYNPTISGDCEDTRPSVAPFDYFTTWSNDKGAEYVKSNNVQFNHLKSWDQYTSALDAKIIDGNGDANTLYIETFWTDAMGPIVSDSLIVGNSLGNNNAGEAGIILAWDRGEILKNVNFFNFPTNTSAALIGTSILTICSGTCGGWAARFQGVTFDNVKLRHKQRWMYDNILQDMDGSLSGKAGNVVVYKDAIFSSKPSCKPSEYFQDGLICEGLNNLIRFSLNNYYPSAATRFNCTDKNGYTVSSLKEKKRMTHDAGFLIVVEAKNEYLMFFDSAVKITNMTYEGAFYDLLPGDYLIIRHPLNSKPDQVKISTALSVESESPLDPATNNQGDWHWDNSTSTMTYLIKNVNKKPILDVPVSFSAIKCQYVGCKPPESPANRAPIAARPDDAVMWSDLATWGGSSFISRRRKRGAAAGFPEDGDSIVIPDDVYVVVDVALPKLKVLEIKGYLEFDNGRDHRLEANIIFINGGQLIIGWENSPITSNVEIILTGEKGSLDYRLPNGIDVLGGKAIGVYGGLDIHGKPRSVIWTTLQNTVRAGESEITLSQPVDWVKGEQITVVTTSFVVEQTEVMTISEVSNGNKTLKLTSSFGYDHIATEENFGNNAGYRVAAAVGLLSRNVKIIGEKYANQDTDIYGGRIVVSDYSNIVNDFLAYYKGFARISNCEYQHPGQFDRGMDGDSKFGILFYNLGENNVTRPSYIKHSALHHGYGTAIGAYKSNGILIDNNIVHRTADYGIVVTGKDNKITNNLVTVNFWAATLLTREKLTDLSYWGAIDISRADSATVTNNFIAGSERLGLHIRGDLCEGETLSGTHLIRNNTIYGSGIGVAVRPDLGFSSLKCMRLTGFTVFKSQYFGIYYQSEATLHVEDSILIENQIAVKTILYAPDPDTHAVGGKKVYQKNLIVVGQTKESDCDKDVYPRNASDSKVLFFTYGASTKGSRIGLVFPTIIGSNTLIPNKPWSTPLDYCQIDGQMVVSNVTFINFNARCGARDVAIASSQRNDDGQHPVTLSDIHLFNVDNSSKVFIHRPDLGLINPSDCIDMDCDGKKKNLITDLDGSLLGSPGTVISHAEFEWGSQARGLGDFRIPKDMLSAADGSMIEPKDLYKHLGIVREEDKCVLNNDWHAYECHGLDYKMLIIESMDHDTEDRRLSPVAILSDNKYLDLINGPQDHGWCLGYTCQKRLSTFMALVSAERSYDIVMTSTPPKMLRFRIINADAKFKIGLSMHYTLAKRTDIYKDDSFVEPTNAYYVDGNMQIGDTEPIQKYKPTYQNASGTNVFIKDDKKVYFSIDGATLIDIKLAPVLSLSFGLPAITPDQFFNEATLVGNFAVLLGIDPSKIRRVEIVRASRRKRDANSQNTVILTISDNPSSSLGNTNAVDQQKKVMDQIDAKVTNLYMTGQLQESAQAVLNVTLSSLAVQKPMSNETAKAVPSKLVLEVSTAAKDCNAQVPCSVQPVIKVVDENGNVAENIGNEDYPWVVVVNMTSSSNPSAKLMSQQEMKVVKGYATFTELGITEKSNFALSYSFKTPEGVNSTKFDPQVQPPAQLEAKDPILSCAQFNSDLNIEQNQAFNLQVSIIDKSTKLKVENISWANYQWMAKVKVHSLGYHKAAGLLNVANATVQFDSSNGLAQFDNLIITEPGMYVLTLTVYTTNSNYDFSCFSKSITVLKTGTVLSSYDANSPPDYILKYEGDYNSIEPEEVKANMYNFMAGYDIIAQNIQAISGSVYITFYSSDSSSNLIDALIAAGVNIDPNLQYSYASINDQILNCTNCVIITGTSTSDDNGEVVGIAVGAIVGAIVGALVGVALLLLAVWGYKEFQKIKVKKTQVTPNGSPEPPIETKTKSKIEKLLQSLTGTTESAYHTNLKTPNLYDRQYLTRSTTPDPTLPRETSYDQGFKYLKN